MTPRRYDLFPGETWVMRILVAFSIGGLLIHVAPQVIRLMLAR